MESTQQAVALLVSEKSRNGEQTQSLKEEEGLSLKRKTPEVETMITQVQNEGLAKEGEPRYDRSKFKKVEMLIFTRIYLDSWFFRAER